MRKFTVHPSIPIKAAIIPYRQSTSDLINNEGLDGRFDYDLPELFTIDVAGIPTTCFTADAETIDVSDYFLAEDFEEVPTGIKYTILIPISSDITVDMVRAVDAGLDRYFDNELWGGDYTDSIGNISISAEDYGYLLDFAEEKLPNAENNIGYCLAKVIIYPAFP
jgi:hypothetical protein